MELNEILRAAAKHGASDVHLKVGLPPVLRINGKLVPLKVPEPLKPEDLEAMTDIVFQDGQKERFERRHELDCAYGVPGWAGSASMCSSSGGRSESSCGSFPSG